MYQGGGMKSGTNPINTWIWTQRGLTKNEFLDERPAIEYWGWWDEKSLDGWLTFGPVQHVYVRRTYVHRQSGDNVTYLHAPTIEGLRSIYNELDSNFCLPDVKLLEGK